jgi:hypothetical protein
MSLLRISGSWRREPGRGRVTYGVAAGGAGLGAVGFLGLLLGGLGGMISVRMWWSIRITACVSIAPASVGLWE